MMHPARTGSDDGLGSSIENESDSEGGEAGEAGEAVAGLYDIINTESDIVFEAGINGDTQCFPGHRRMLAASGPVFAALLRTNNDFIVLDYVDRRGFDQLMRYHYCEPTQLNSVETARYTLDVAYTFLTPLLTERSARRLDEMLDVSVALELLSDLRHLCFRLPGSVPKPPLPALSYGAAARMLAQCSRWCNSLAHNVLLFLDDNADAALTHEWLEELSYEDLALFVQRDTLRVSSEMILVDALSRWATAACMRNENELTPENKREALGELVHSVRYLLMSGDELEHALELELLRPVERELVAARARHMSAPMPVDSQKKELLRYWMRPRPLGPMMLPVFLSPRSEPPSEEPRPSGLCARRPRRLKAPNFIPEENYLKKSCCTSFSERLLQAFICLYN